MAILMWLIGLMSLTAWAVALWLSVWFALHPATRGIGVAMLAGGTAGLMYLAFRLLYEMVVRYSAW
jgi:hypothetical protein